MEGVSRASTRFCFAAVVAVLAIAATSRPTALGQPGMTPVPCPHAGVAARRRRRSRRCRARRRSSASTTAASTASRSPTTWNGELALYAHGFVSNAGAHGSALRVGNSPIREHLIKNGYAWAASSYRCNGYVPGQGLLDTMALDRSVHEGRTAAARRSACYLTGDVDGRPRHAARHARVPDGVRRRPRDVSGRTGAVRLLRGHQRRAAEVITGVQFKLDTMQQDRREDERDCSASRRTTPTRAVSWRASRSRSAAGRGRSRSKGWRRAFAGEHQHGRRRSPAAPRRRIAP